MSSDDVLAYFDVLAAVAWSDGRIDPTERSFIMEAARGLAVADHRLASLVALLDGEPPDVRAMVDRAAARFDASALADVLRDAYILAATDGSIEGPEIAAIEQLLQTWGAREESRPVLHEWARTAAETFFTGVALLGESRTTTPD